MDAILVILALIGFLYVCSLFGPAPTWLRFGGNVIAWSWVTLMALLMAWSVGYGVWAAAAWLIAWARP